MGRTIRVKGKVRYCDNYVDNRIIFGDSRVYYEL